MQENITKKSTFENLNSYFNNIFVVDTKIDCIFTDFSPSSRENADRFRFRSQMLNVTSLFSRGRSFQKIGHGYAKNLLSGRCFLSVLSSIIITALTTGFGHWYTLPMKKKWIVFQEVMQRSLLIPKNTFSDQDYSFHSRKVFKTPLSVNKLFT